MGIEQPTYFLCLYLEHLRLLIVWYVNGAKCSEPVPPCVEREPSSTAPPPAAGPNLGGSATVMGLFCLLKNKNDLTLSRRKALSFFLQMTDQRFFWPTTLIIEFYANLIIPINCLGDFLVENIPGQAYFTAFNDLKKDFKFFYLCVFC